MNKSQLHNASINKLSMPNEIKDFYRKGETPKEIFDAIGSVKSHFEHGFDPVVIIKLGDPDQADKFVTFMDEGGRSYFVALPILKKAFHRDIINFIKEFFRITPINIKGGWIQQKDGCLFLDGESQDYGEADKVRSLQLINSQYPGIEVKYETLEEEKSNKEKHHYREYRSSLNPSQRILLDKVYNGEGVRMGNDMIKGPFPITGSDCSYLIYVSENGSSFGCDTLFISKPTDDGGDIKLYKVAISRWYMNDVHIVSLGDNILQIKYESNGNQTSLKIDLGEFESSQTHYSDFSQIDHQLLDMYQQSSDTGFAKPCTYFSKG